MRRIHVAATLLLCVVWFLSGPAVPAEDPSDGHHLVTGPVEIIWEARFDGPMSGIEHASSIASSPDGSAVYVTGESYGTFFNLDYLTIAYDADSGTQLWQARFDGPWSKHDSAKKVLVSPDGETVFVSGTSVSYWDTDWDFVTVAYEAATGSPVWEARYHGHQRDEGWTNSIAVSPDGAYVVMTAVGDCMGNSTTALTTLAYDAATGAELWRACNSSAMAYGDFPAEPIVSPDSSKVFVTGSRLDSSLLHDYWTVAYDGASGVELWCACYDYPPAGADSYDAARAIAVSPDGKSVFVTGESRGAGTQSDIATVAYDAASGAQRWVSRFDGPMSADDRAYAMAVGPDGRTVFVTGQSEAPSSDHEIALLAYDAATGAERWSTLFDGPGAYHDSPRAIAISPDGHRVFVAGETWGENSADRVLVSFDASTGERLWLACFDGPISHADFCRGIALGPNGGRIFVTGHSCGCGATDFDYRSAAYSVVRHVEIDVKPGSHPAHVNPRSRGVMPVVIFGSAETEVSEIDIGTLGLAPTGAGPPFGLSDGFVRSHEMTDLNLDGHMDLIVRCRVPEMGIACGDDSLSLTAWTADGALLEASHPIVTVGCRDLGARRSRR